MNSGSSSSAWRPCRGPHVAQAAQRVEAGLDRRHDRQPFAGGRDDGLLDDAGGLVDPLRQIGDQPVDLLRLRRRERDRPRRFLRDRVGARDEWPDVLLHRSDRLLRLPREPQRRDDRADLDRAPSPASRPRSRRGTGSDQPLVHRALRRRPPGASRRRAPVRRLRGRARSRTRACPCRRLTNSRPCRAASVARSRPSRAFSASIRRVSSPDAGRHQQRHRRARDRAEHERHDDCSRCAVISRHRVSPP